MTTKDFRPEINQALADPERRELAPAKLRESHGVSPRDIAAIFEEPMPASLPNDHEHGLLVATLAAYVAALGGHLELTLTAVFPNEPVRIDQLSGSSS